eukprot:160983_1
MNRFSHSLRKFTRSPFFSNTANIRSAFFSNTTIYQNSCLLYGINHHNKPMSKKRPLENASVDQLTKKPKILNSQKVVNEDANKRLTKKEFLDKAYNKLETVECGDDKIVMAKRLFSTGSVGWHGALHSKKTVANKDLCVMYSINAVVMKSKKWDIGGEIEDEKPEPNKKNQVEKDKATGGDDMTMKEFMESAGDLVLKFGNTNVVCKPKKMSTGNVGWFGNSNMKRTIQYQQYRVLMSVNITVKGSKDWQ